MVGNPWQALGVSVIPPNLSEMLPLVGQEDLYFKLASFKTQMRSSGPRDLTGFFVLEGSWGVGKSRVGHEICLEAVDPEIRWVAKGRGQRILEPHLSERILPIFVRYSQVTDGPLSVPLAAETWIPLVTHRALSLLIAPPPLSGSSLRRNQARLFQELMALLNFKGLRQHEADLKAALRTADVGEGVRSALGVLRNIGIERLWLVVDEIEDITDVEGDGLTDPDRKGIDQASLTVVPRVIKREEVRQDFPELSFLLLCARSVGNVFREIRALERRTGFHDLRTNAFADVQAYFDYIQRERPETFAEIEQYPKGLKEAAFFAANRNFGWFNVIMHFCHENRQIRDVADLIKRFADFSDRASYIFDRDATSDLNIRADADKPEVLSLIYRQLPSPIGGDGLTADAAQRFIARKHYGTNEPLFARVIEVVPPPPDQIMAEMRRAGFLWVDGNNLQLPGEQPFDLGLVLESLRSYSIGLPDPASGHLLIFESVEQFTEQIRGLTPYESQARLLAGPLHSYLTQDSLVVKDQSGPRTYIAPSFTFLLRFLQQNRRGQVEAGYLRDAAANARLEEAYSRVKNQPVQRVACLLRGLAQVWESGIVSASPDAALSFPNLAFSASRTPLSLGASGRVTLIHASGVEESKLLADLDRLAPRPERPAHPVLLVLEGAADREEDLREKIRRSKPGLAPFVVARSFTPYQAEILIRQGLMGQAFTPEESLTNLFAGGTSLVRQHLFQALEGGADTWRASLERRGLVLRPIFYRKTIRSDEIAALARGYALMLGGVSYSALLQESEKRLTSDEKDLFRKRTGEHVEPPSKYEGHVGLGLFTSEGGALSARVPRALLTMLDRMGAVARTVADLEPLFLYDAADPRPNDVLRQAVLFLNALGFVHSEGAGRYRRVSEKSLADELDRCSTWLDGSFQERVSAIAALHRGQAQHLADVLAKEARQEIKDASRRLGDLHLEFVSWPWERLEEVQPSSKSPQYEDQFTRAVDVVTALSGVVSRVYFPEEADSFTYSPDTLTTFEQESVLPGYPLWKRVGVLAGFYADLAGMRSQLRERIAALLRKDDGRVPAGRDGEKVFPTQVLSAVLRLWDRELDFPAESPQRSVDGVGSSYATQMLGFKIARGKYREAWQRVVELEQQLVGPGGLPARYFRCLDHWDQLRHDESALRGESSRWQAFFADASPAVRARYDVPRLTDAVDAFADIVCDGGIRDGTDQREAAGHEVLRLIDGLESDLANAEQRPEPIRRGLSTMGDSVLQNLREEYGRQHRSLMSAFARVRKVQGHDLPEWPGALGQTYGSTVEAFELVVRRAEQECGAFFSDVEGVNWRDYQALCEMDAEGKEIPWEQPPYDRYVGPLQRKGLIRLRLV